jgi:hypothetical protein
MGTLFFFGGSNQGDEARLLFRGLRKSITSDLQ